MNEKFIDKEFGLIQIKRNSRAKNIIARKKDNSIELTAPLRISIDNIIQAFEQLKPRLKNLRAKSQNILNTETTLETMSFSVKIENRLVKNFHSSLKDGLLLITCPNIDNFEDSRVQSILRNTIEQTMRLEAKRIFPEKLDKLANQFNFSYNGLRINKSKTRWGSCSSQQNINLSYYCLFLPEYLVDFVMLHELCHTIEMNHGDNFWRLLDSVTNNMSKPLTAELKTINTIL